MLFAVFPSPSSKAYNAKQPGVLHWNSNKKSVGKFEISVKNKRGRASETTLKRCPVALREAGDELFFCDRCKKRIG